MLRRRLFCIGNDPKLPTDEGGPLPPSSRHRSDMLRVGIMLRPEPDDDACGAFPLDRVLAPVLAQDFRKALVLYIF